MAVCRRNRQRGVDSCFLGNGLCLLIRFVHLSVVDNASAMDQNKHWLLHCWVCPTESDLSEVTIMTGTYYVTNERFVSKLLSW